MKRTSKTLLLVLCAVLLVTASVMGTMAYLTSTSETVENTFTVGKVAITLDEAKVDEYGVEVEGADRVTANSYKLIPGHTYVKDPTIHVGADSEDCWVYAKIENGLGTNATINIDLKSWVVLDDKSSEGYIIYAYNEDVSAEDDIVVFTEFTYADDVTNTATDAGRSIKVTAFAVQADGFDTATEAWDGAFGTAVG